MNFGTHHKIGLAICTPHRKIKLPNGQEIVDTITVQWMRARNGLHFGTNLATIELFCDGMEVGAARSAAAHRCLEHPIRPEFLLFLDDDVLPDYDAVIKLMNHLRWNPDVDVAAGLYTNKHSQSPDPLLYSGDGAGPFWDWAIGDVLRTESHGISAVHMGLTVIRVSLFQRMLDAGVVTDEIPFFETQSVRERVNGAIRSHQSTEDINFFTKANQVGCKILVDTSVLAGHIDKNTGVTYGLHPDSPPVKRAKWLGGKDQKEAEEEGLKLALDLGAGGRRRHWEGYKTYTLDIRPDAKPDYCQDTRSLNFPDGHWDLLASSHHLEHLGRWDQEQVFQEMARITKPGGRWEHIVPSIEWAARKISEGEVCGSVLDVLYGAQEAHNYARHLNLHYFGFTKAVFKALAEQAGMANVVCRDWTDDASLGYNLVLTATKPSNETQTDERQDAVDGDGEAGPPGQLHDDGRRDVKRPPSGEDANGHSHHVPEARPVPVLDGVGERSNS